MTEPGYPDFQARQTTRGAPLIPYGPYTFTPAGTGFGPVPINSFQGVELYVAPTVGPALVSVYLSPDQLPQDAILPVAWTVLAGQVLNVVIPASGDYLFINIASAGGGSITATAYAAPVTTTSSGYKFTNPNPELIRQNVNIAAGATDIFALPVFTAGECFCSVNTLSGSNQLQISVCTLTGVGGFKQRFYYFGAPVGPAAVTLLLPAQPCGMQVVNTDGAAGHNLDLAMIPQLAA